MAHLSMNTAGARAGNRTPASADRLAHVAVACAVFFILAIVVLL